MATQKLTIQVNGKDTTVTEGTTLLEAVGLLQALPL
jgi:NADH dehydrogenase/NADH:ubiquinone oxidoreductase subunit G